MLEGLYSITPGPFIFKAKKEFQEMYSLHFYPLKLADFIRLAKGAQPRERRLSPLVTVEMILYLILLSKPTLATFQTLQNVLIGV